ncbi:MAG: tRNA 2-thiouridine(34) synthase MnmA [Lachnospiraceae bacterium]|jgi:tRNA-specific 2-thiouridylase|nr:tRNA 2-thiouridine(34) synthase MnmA [Lachnospiraceae bacterium]
MPVPDEVMSEKNILPGKPNAWIAMSGGVDSSVAAYLTKKEGFDCTGVMMKLFRTKTNEGGRETGGSCLHIASDGTQVAATTEAVSAATDVAAATATAVSVATATAVATLLGISFRVLDLVTEFDEEVITPFVTAYQNGETPNPCVECNRAIKFGKLLEQATRENVDYLVTGHYARIEYDNHRGRFLLKKAVDISKDQSYFLYSLTQTQLKKLRFPLGGLEKDKVREIAAAAGLGNAYKRDSQDICFIADGDYGSFIKERTKEGEQEAGHGNFIDIEGNILGQHKGICHYTIGQRRGLGLSLKKPLYVHSKNIVDNTVTLCEEGLLYERTLIADDFIWSSIEKPISPIRVMAKIRHTKAEQAAIVTVTGADTVKVVFDLPQRAIAKGQAVVLYDGDVVLGGGRIR